MKIKIVIHTDLTLAMQTEAHVTAALQQLALDLSQSGPLFVGKKITICAVDGNEVGYFKVKE